MPRVLGKYFLLHRIDGKLVACSMLLIGKRYLGSKYFIYDTDYKFLNLGVMSVIRELEYMKLLIKLQGQSSKLEKYMLGDVSLSCPKLSYKLNYQPGYIQCPRTKRELPFAQV